MSDYDPVDIEEQGRLSADSESRERLSCDNEHSDLVWKMSDARGRRMVWQQLERAGVFRLSFDPNPLIMAFNEGLRNEGVRLMDKIHAVCPDLYHVMVKEQNDEQRYTDNCR